jgi:hypothetical protein
METTNYIKHLTGVYNSISSDTRLNPSHISLYMAIFQLWNMNRFPEIFFIDRAEAMQLSKIGSQSTYHKCIRELDQWTYLKYLPSRNHFKGSMIKMINFEKSITRLDNPNLPKIDTTSIHVPTNLPKSVTSSVPEADKNNTKNWTRAGHNEDNLPKSGTISVPEADKNNTKNLTCDGHEKDNLPKSGTSSVPEEDKNNTKNWTRAGHEEDKINTKNWTRAGHEEDMINTKNWTRAGQELVSLINNNKHNKQKKTVETGAPKNELEVIDFFKNENWPEIEAKKFFNYYQGLNWSVGQTKIYDWHAIAKIWMLRMKEVAQAQKTVPQKPDNLKTCNFKNFNEPL